MINLEGPGGQARRDHINREFRKAGGPWKRPIGGSSVSLVVPMERCRRAVLNLARLLNCPWLWTGCASEQARNCTGKDELLQRVRQERWHRDGWRGLAGNDVVPCLGLPSFGLETERTPKPCFLGGCPYFLRSTHEPEA